MGVRVADAEQDDVVFGKLGLHSRLLMRGAELQVLTKLVTSPCRWEGREFNERGGSSGNQICVLVCLERKLECSSIVLVPKEDEAIFHLRFRGEMTWLQLLPPRRLGSDPPGGRVK